MEHNLLLKQQREYDSVVIFDINDANGAVVKEFYTQAGDNEFTNLDIPQQISNSGSFTVYMQQFVASIGTNLEPTQNQFQALRNLILNGRLQLKINKIDVANFRLTRLLKPAWVGANSLTSFDPLYDSIEGKFKLNEPWFIGSGQSFSLTLKTNFQGVDPTGLGLLSNWIGMLDLSQTVTRG